MTGNFHAPSSHLCLPCSYGNSNLTLLPGIPRNMCPPALLPLLHPDQSDLGPAASSAIAAAPDAQGLIKVVSKTLFLIGGAARENR